RTEEIVFMVGQVDRTMEELMARAQRRKAALEKMIKDTVPTANVKVLIFGYTVVLTGTVSKAEEVQVIMELARSQYPESHIPVQSAPAAPAPPGAAPTGVQPYQGPLIVNAMRIGGVQQVALEVVVARVNRSELRQMTFNFLINHDSYFVGSVL